MTAAIQSPISRQGFHPAGLFARAMAVVMTVSAALRSRSKFLTAAPSIRPAITDLVSSLNGLRLKPNRSPTTPLLARV